MLLWKYCSMKQINLGQNFWQVNSLVVFYYAFFYNSFRMLRFKKILLVNPPKIEQGGHKPSPLSLLYLAAYLRKHCPDIKIKIADGALNGESEIIDNLKNFKPQLIRISSLTPGRYQALKIIKSSTGKLGLIENLYNLKTYYE